MNISAKMRAYSNKGFDEYQLKEIRLGLESNVDTSIYANSEFDDIQMGLIRIGLEKGLDVSILCQI